MKWIPVDGSQISHIGYEPGADYPLGVMFKPNKKQTAAGQPGSVYEYANVSPELFQAFAEAKTNPSFEFSFGKFFERVIKAYPLTYPYRKTDQKVDLGPVNLATDEL
jgi:hypothetical protein